MPINEYYIGQEVRITAVTKVSTTLTDPTTLTLRIKLPDATVIVKTYALAEVVKDSLGNFHFDYTPAVTGKFRWRWEATGAVLAVDEGYFKILGSSVV